MQEQQQGVALRPRPASELPKPQKRRQQEYKVQQTLSIPQWTAACYLPPFMRGSYHVMFEFNPINQQTKNYKNMKLLRTVFNNFATCFSQLNERSENSLNFGEVSYDQLCNQIYLEFSPQGFLQTSLAVKLVPLKQYYVYIYALFQEFGIIRYPQIYQGAATPHVRLTEAIVNAISERIVALLRHKSEFTHCFQSLSAMIILYRTKQILVRYLQAEQQKSKINLYGYLIGTISCLYNYENLNEESGACLVEFYTRSHMKIFLSELYAILKIWIIFTPIILGTESQCKPLMSIKLQEATFDNLIEDEFIKDKFDWKYSMKSNEHRQFETEKRYLFLQALRLQKHSEALSYTFDCLYIRKIGNKYLSKLESNFKREMNAGIELITGILIGNTFHEIVFQTILKQIKTYSETITSIYINSLYFLALAQVICYFFDYRPEEYRQIKKKVQAQYLRYSSYFLANVILINPKDTTDKAFRELLDQKETQREKSYKIQVIQQQKKTVKIGKQSTDTLLLSDLSQLDDLQVIQLGNKNHMDQSFALILDAPNKNGIYFDFQAGVLLRQSIRHVTLLNRIRRQAFNLYEHDKKEVKYRDAGKKLLIRANVNKLKKKSQQLINFFLKKKSTSYMISRIAVSNAAKTVSQSWISHAALRIQNHFVPGSRIKQEDLINRNMKQQGIISRRMLYYLAQTPAMLNVSKAFGDKAKDLRFQYQNLGAFLLVLSPMKTAFLQAYRRRDTDVEISIEQIYSQNKQRIDQSNQKMLLHMERFYLEKFRPDKILEEINSQEYSAEKTEALRNYYKRVQEISKRFSKANKFLVNYYETEISLAVSKINDPEDFKNLLQKYREKEDQYLKEAMITFFNSESSASTGMDLIFHYLIANKLNIDEDIFNRGKADRQIALQMNEFFDLQFAGMKQTISKFNENQIRRFITEYTRRFQLESVTVAAKRLLEIFPQNAEITEFIAGASQNNELHEMQVEQKKQNQLMVYKEVNQLTQKYIYQSMAIQKAWNRKSFYFLAVQAKQQLETIMKMGVKYEKSLEQIEKKNQEINVLATALAGIVKRTNDQVGMDFIRKYVNMKDFQNDRSLQELLKVAQNRTIYSVTKQLVASKQRLRIAMGEEMPQKQIIEDMRFLSRLSKKEQLQAENNQQFFRALEKNLRKFIKIKRKDQRKEVIMSAVLKLTAQNQILSMQIKAATQKVIEIKLIQQVLRGQPENERQQYLYGNTLFQNLNLAVFNQMFTELNSQISMARYFDEDSVNLRNIQQNLQELQTMCYGTFRACVLVQQMWMDVQRKFDFAQLSEKAKQDFLATVNLEGMQHDIFLTSYANLKSVLSINTKLLMYLIVQQEKKSFSEQKRKMTLIQCYQNGKKKCNKAYLNFVNLIISSKYNKLMIKSDDTYSQLLLDPIVKQRFLKTLTSIYNEQSQQFKEKLEQILKDWMKELKQIDKQMTYIDRLYKAMAYEIGIEFEKLQMLIFIDENKRQKVLNQNIQMLDHVQQEANEKAAELQILTMKQKKMTLVNNEIKKFFRNQRPIELALNKFLIYLKSQNAQTIDGILDKAMQKEDFKKKIQQISKNTGKQLKQLFFQKEDLRKEILQINSSELTSSQKNIIKEVGESIQKIVRLHEEKKIAVDVFKESLSSISKSNVGKYFKIDDSYEWDDLKNIKYNIQSMLKDILNTTRKYIEVGKKSYKQAQMIKLQLISAQADIRDLQKKIAQLGLPVQRNQREPILFNDEQADQDYALALQMSIDDQMTPQGRQGGYGMEVEERGQEMQMEQNKSQISQKIQEQKQIVNSIQQAVSARAQNIQREINGQQEINANIERNFEQDVNNFFNNIFRKSPETVGMRIISELQKARTQQNPVQDAYYNTLMNLNEEIGSKASEKYKDDFTKCLHGRIARIFSKKSLENLSNTIQQSLIQMRDVSERVINDPQSTQKEKNIGTALLQSTVSFLKATQLLKTYDTKVQEKMKAALLYCEKAQQK